jgi:predicted TIM-barrel fold metal-dependent hydrolase
MKSFPIIDADGHVTETNESLKRHLKKEFRNRPLMHSEPWDRTFGGTLGKRNEDPQVQLQDMDLDGIDIQVIFPSHLSLNVEREADLATDIARAYNDWLAEFCATDPKRLKGVAMVALQDIQAAIREVRRAAEELGFVGVMMPTNVRDQDIGRREYWPFYEEVERLGIGLALHGGIRAAERMHGRFDTFIAVHSLSFPFECMAAVTGLVFAGVPEKFPKLRIAALEACCGWVPFLMDRLDEEYEKRGWKEAPLLKKKPSE